MERNEMVEQILSRVMEKLAAAGETVTETELMQSLASAAAPLPGLLVLTQEHGTDCHKLLESPRIKEKYRTGCALLNEGETTLDGIEAVVLFNLTTEAMCKLASGITDTSYTKRAAQALLMGKKLYVPRGGALQVSGRRAWLLPVHAAGTADKACILRTEDLPAGRAGGLHFRRELLRSSTGAAKGRGRRRRYMRREGDGAGDGA